MVTLQMIQEAQESLKGIARKTPLENANRLGENIYIKSENLQLTGAFKLRGAYNKIRSLTPEEARAYMAEGQFAPGSMLPKVEAAVKFAESKPGRTALITLLEKARDGIDGRTGTRIAVR